MPADAPALPKTPQPESGQTVVNSPAPAINPSPLLERELRTSPSEQPAQKHAPSKTARAVKPAAELSSKGDESSAKSVETDNRTVVDKTKSKPATKTTHSDSLAGKQIRPEQKSGNYYRQAQLYLQQGRVAEAQALLLQALDTNRLNHDARLTLAGLLVDNKRNDEARALLQAGLEVAPEQSEFSLALSRLQLDAGNNAGALATLEQGLPYAKNDADYHGFLATLLQRDGRHDEAIDHYQIALAGNSTMPSWLVGLGISLQAAGRLEEAQQVFQRAQSGANLSPELAQFVDQRLKQIRQRLR
jgi:MSHA biogenesis protein MshN